MKRQITDDEIWHFWVTRSKIYNGDLKPQLVEFARTVIAFNDGLQVATSVDPVSPAVESTGRPPMRVSVLRNDRGFTMTPQLFSIKLNGQQVKNAIIADESQGFIERYNADGSDTEVIFGKVEISFTEQGARRLIAASSALSARETPADAN